MVIMLPLKTKKIKHQSGQALLLVLLSMAVILTVVLSVSTKSISDVSIGTYEEDALRAFSAAEAGIEKALLTNEEFTNQQVDPSDGSVSFTSDITSSPAGSTFEYPNPLFAGESATFWFAARNLNGNFDCSTPSCFVGNKFKYLCWGTNTYSSESEKPAVMLSVYYDDSTPPKYLSGDFSNIKVKRLAYDPVNRGNNFNFSDVKNGCTVGDQNFNYYVKDIGFNSNMGIPATCVSATEGCLIMARVKVFYTSPGKSENIAVDMSGGGPGSILPAQGNKIESIGTAGNSTRKINVYQSFAEPPGIFDAAVFSETGFSH